MNQGAQSRHPEYQYLDILQDILDHGDRRMDRTGVGTLALFGRHMRYDVSKTFPVLTTRKIYWKTAIKEMLWMLSGSTTFATSSEQDVHIWTDWPLAKYREETGEEISQAEFEARILGDDGFAEKHGSIGRTYQASGGTGGVRGGRKESTRYKSWLIRSSRIPPAVAYSGKAGTLPSST